MEEARPADQIPSNVSSTNDDGDKIKKKELYQQYNHPNIVRVIKPHVIERWMVLVKVNKKVVRQMLFGRISTERPEIRYLNQIEKDPPLYQMGNWKVRAYN